MVRESIRPYVWMLCGSLAFALMGGLAHALGLRCDWRWVLLARTALPLVFVMALALSSGVKLVFWRPPSLWMRSIAGGLSVIGTFYALPLLPLSDVYTLTNMFPIWVAALSWPLLGEVPPGSIWVAVASGVAGVALIQQPHVAEGNLASLITLAVSFTTAIAMIGLHRLKGIDPRAIVIHFSGVALAMSLACFFLPARTEPSLNLDREEILMLLGIGVLATIGQLFLTKAFATGHPAKVSVVGLTQIVFTMLLDVLLLDYSIDWVKLTGIFLVVVPTAWLMARSRRGAMVGGQESVEGDGASVDVDPCAPLP